MLHALIRLFLELGFLVEGVVVPESMEDKNADGKSGSWYRLAHTLQLRQTVRLLPS